MYVATLDNLGIETNGIWKSTDFGETFTRIDRAPHSLPNEFLNLTGRGITVDPRRHSTVYFADRSSGIWRSMNAGTSWYHVDATPVFSVTVDPTDSNIVYAGTNGNGVLKSTDGGSSFIQTQNQLAGSRTSRTGSVQVARNTQIFSTSEPRMTVCSRVPMETWFPINSGLDNLGVVGFAMAPGSRNILYAATSSSVFKKTTAGR